MPFVLAGGEQLAALGRSSPKPTTAGLDVPVAPTQPAKKLSFKKAGKPIAEAPPPSLEFSAQEYETPKLSLDHIMRSPQTRSLLQGRNREKFAEAMDALDQAQHLRGQKFRQGDSALTAFFKGTTPTPVTPEKEAQAKELETKAEGILGGLMPKGGYGQRWISNAEAEKAGILPTHSSADSFPVERRGHRIKRDPNAGGWYNLDPKTMEYVQAQQEQRNKERYVEAVRGPQGKNSVLGDLFVRGPESGLNTVAGVVARVGEDVGALPEGTADASVRLGNAMETVNSQGDSSKLNRFARGTGSSLTQAAVGAALGYATGTGAAGTIMTFAAGATNQAYTDGLDMGMTPDEAKQYAIHNGLVEGGITAAFQMIPGMAGFEKMFGKGAVKEMSKNILKQLPKDVAAEQLEELTISTVTEFVSRAHGIDPQSLPELLVDTFLQTGMMMGLTSAPAGAAQGVRALRGTTDNPFVGDPLGAAAWAAGNDAAARKIAEAFKAGKPITRQMMHDAGLPRGDQGQRTMFARAVSAALESFDAPAAEEQNTGPTTQGPQPGTAPAEPAQPPQPRTGVAQTTPEIRELAQKSGQSPESLDGQQVTDQYLNSLLLPQQVTAMEDAGVISPADESGLRTITLSKSLQVGAALPTAANVQPGDMVVTNDGTRGIVRENADGAMKIETDKGMVDVTNDQIAQHRPIRPKAKPQPQKPKAAPPVEMPTDFTISEQDVARSEEPRKAEQYAKQGVGYTPLPSNEQLPSAGVIHFTDGRKPVKYKKNKEGTRGAMIVPERNEILIDGSAYPLDTVARIDESSLGSKKDTAVWTKYEPGGSGETQTEVPQAQQAATEATPPKVEKPGIGPRTPSNLVERADIGPRLTPQTSGQIGPAVSAKSDPKHHAAQQERVAAALRKLVPGLTIEEHSDGGGVDVILPRNGRRIRLRRVEYLTASDRAAFEASARKQLTDAEWERRMADGSLTFKGGFVMISEDADVAMFGDGLIALNDKTFTNATIAHELLHAALSLGLIDVNGKEYKALAKKYGKPGMTGLQLEEAIVNAWEQWYRGNPIWKKIVEFFTKLADLATLGRTNSATQVMGRIGRGEVFARPSRTEDQQDRSMRFANTAVFSVGDQVDRKLPPGRSPDLTAAAQMVKDGEMTRAEFAAEVERYKAIRPNPNPPVVPADKKIAQYIDKPKVALIGANRKLADGTPVGLRIDIPTFNRSTAAGDPTYAIAVHAGATGKSKIGSIIGYSGAASVRNPRFLVTSQKAGLDIAAGKSKTPLATVEGEYIKRDESTAPNVSGPEWSQVGYDPERHGFFYDKKTGEPIIGGDEAVLIGSTVYVRNAKGVNGNAPEGSVDNPAFLYSVGEAGVAGVETAADIAEAKQAWRQLGVESPWFKNWFGSSVVVNEDGSPKEMFHGGVDNFDVVDVEKGEWGFHVGSLQQAEERAAAKADTHYDFPTQRVTSVDANVMPLYIRLENPIRLEDAGSWTKGEILTQLINKGVITHAEAVSTTHEDDFLDNSHGAKQKIIALLQSKGFDGAVYLNRFEGIDTSDDTFYLSDEKFREKHPDARDSYIVFDPSQVKSSIGNRGTFDNASPSILYSTEEDPAPIWVDNILEGLKSWQAKGTPAQLLAHLQKTKGTNDEAKWIGLDEFLAGKQSVTREEVAAFVEANRVQLQEVVNEEDAGDTNYSEYQLPGGSNYREMLLTLPGPVPPGLLPKREQFTLWDENGDAIAQGDRTAYERWIRQDPNARTTRAMVRDENEIRKWGNVYTSSHWQGVVNPLVHIRFNERITVDQNKDHVVTVYEPGKRYARSGWSSRRFPNKAAAEAFAEVKRQGGYTTVIEPAFDAKSRVLFLEEVQSDWHQSGRKEGYRPRGARVLQKDDVEYEGKSLAASGYKFQIVLSQKHEDGYHRPGALNVFGNSIEEVRANALERITGLKGSMNLVPDAPFKQSWPMLAVKRMIRWAAEHGFDKLAWTTGAQQADRYDLSNRVDSISVFKDDGVDSVMINAFKNGENVGSQQTKLTDLDGLVGKDLAEKIRKQEGDHTYSGLDLKVGGEGMKGFYDRILPTEIGKFAKKFGGKVGTTEIEVASKDYRPDLYDYKGEIDEDGVAIYARENGYDDYEFVDHVSGNPGEMVAEHELNLWILSRPTGFDTVHSLDITPEMKASAMQGMLMFSVDPEDRTTVSTRKPSNKIKGVVSDRSYREELLVNSDELFGSEERMANLQSQMGNFIALSPTDDNGNQKSPRELLKELYSSIVDNLLWLHDHMEPGVRARAKLWYDGANRITKAWANKFQLDPRQVAGILAVLSPQMDWFRNVSLAERAMRILREHGHERWSDGMTQWFESWVNSSTTVSEKDKRRAHLANAMRIRDSGLTLSELADKDTGLFIRAFDEAYFSRRYRLVTPEGGFGVWAEKENAANEEEYEVTEEGDKILPGAVTWSGFATISKTAAIFRATPGVDLMRVLDDKLGAEHKVRNFYNNIIDPNSKSGHVTIDSHAAAAAYIRATSGADETTKMSLGSKGGGSAEFGSSGLYGLVADAYREAAAKRGILAREMQSITWEAVRSLFPAKEKRVKKYKRGIDAVWDRVRKGELSPAAAREEISVLARGIKKLAWEGTPEGRGVEDGGTSYDGELSGDPAVRATRLMEERIAMDSITVNLSPATTSIPGIKKLHDRARAGDVMAHQLLQDIAFDNLTNLVAGLPSVSITKNPSTGLYGGDIEPSLSLTIKFGEAVKNEILPRIKKFADNFNQEQVHVRKAAGKQEFQRQTGRAEDGSFVTPVIRFKLEGSLTIAETQAIIDSVNQYALDKPRGPFKPGPRKLKKSQVAKHHPFSLPGLTVGDGFIEAYYAGDPSNAVERAKWYRSVWRVHEELGDRARGVHESFARLWAYGGGDGGIGWAGVPSYVPAQQGTSLDLISNKTTERIAAYLMRVGDTPGDVHGFEQAPKITKEQSQLQRRIMEIYDTLPDFDKRAIVKRAYNEANAAILEQYLSLPIKVELQRKKDSQGNPIKHGRRGRRDGRLKYEIAGFEEGEPYANSAAMRQDVGISNHMSVFATTPDTFGPPGMDFSKHPLLQPAMVKNDKGVMVPVTDSNGVRLLYNDLLRAVHDYFAHTLTPSEFGPKGEEAAWANHMAVTMNPWARWAITTETRGQNSWVNFRPGVEKMTKLERGFAAQKAALLPIEYTYTGNAEVDAVMKEFAKTLTEEERNGSAKTKKIKAAIGKADAYTMLYSTETAESADSLYERPKGGAIGSLYRWLLTSRGNLPERANQLKEQMHGYIAVHEREMRFVMADLKRAVKQVYGDVPELNSRDWNLIDRVLRGGDPNVLPLPVREPVVRMRSHVDHLSRAIIESGAASETLAATIDQNMGVYLTRTYRVFSDPKWADKVPEEIKNRFRVWLRNEYPDLTQNELEHQYEVLLRKHQDSPLRTLAGGKLGAKLLDVLKARKELPLELRELWGEETNPLINYAASIGKMSQLVASQQFLSQAREAGIGKWLFEDGDPNIDPEAKVKIAADGNSPMAPLNGLWTYPEILKAFEDEYASPQQHPVWRWYFTINSLAKAAKTVGAMVTQVRNFISNVGMVAANGNWNPKHLADAFRAAAPGLEGIGAKRALGGRVDYDAWREFHKRLVNLGVIGEDVGIGELRTLLSDAKLQTSGKLLNNTLVRTLKGTATAAADIYQTSDNFWKAFAWASERAKYQQAFPDLTADELDRLAARVVRDTMPTYSKIPKGIQALRHIPFGNFFSWPAEIVRTSINTVWLGINEISQKETRMIGGRRLAGAFLAVSLPAAAQMAINWFLGVTPEEDEDKRRFVPPWSKNSQIAWLEDGRYVDLSYMDPYAYLRKPVMALLRGDDTLKAAGEAAKELADPFFTEQLIGERLLDISARGGQTADGRTIFNPEDNLGRKVAHAFMHVLQPLVPGTANSIYNVKRGFTGEISEQGKVFDPQLELFQMVSGARISKIDIPQSLGFKAGAFDKSMGNSDALFSRLVKSRGNVSSEELADAYQRADNARRRNFDEMHKDIHAALRQGVSEEDVKVQLKSRGVSQEMTERLISGKYEPYRLSKESTDEIRSRPNGPQRVADAQTLYIANSANPQDALEMLRNEEQKRIRGAQDDLRFLNDPSKARERALPRRGEGGEKYRARQLGYKETRQRALETLKELGPRTPSSP